MPSGCTDSCRAPVQCVRCHRRKAPRGRSVAAEMANGMCTQDCPGFQVPPMSGHLWPNEKLPGEEIESEEVF